MSAAKRSGDEDAGGEEPFELEDGPEAEPRDVAPVEEPPPRVIVPPPAQAGEVRVPKEDGAVEVSEKTLHERLHPDAPVVRGPIPPPPGGPREAWGFPLRGGGLRSLLGAGLGWALADVLTGRNAFLGAVVKIGLGVGLLRWQVRTIASSATGSDAPPRAFDGADFEIDALGGLLATALRFAAYVAPAGFLVLSSVLEHPDEPGLSGGGWALFVALLAIGLLLAPVLLFAEALRMPALAWPWNALSCFLRALRPCLVLAASWAALLAGEWAVPGLSRLPVALGLPIFLGLRCATFVLGLVGARGLGVLGRSYGP